MKKTISLLQFEQQHRNRLKAVPKTVPRLFVNRLQYGFRTTLRRRQPSNVPPDRWLLIRSQNNRGDGLPLPPLPLSESRRIERVPAGRRGSRKSLVSQDETLPTHFPPEEPRVATLLREECLYREKNA